MSRSNSNTPAKSRPSDRRRKALNVELAMPTVSSLFPLDRYYATAEKVQQSFQMSYEKSVSATRMDAESDQALDDAYVYGKRYCTFCLEGIPHHDYYNSPKFRSLQRKHTLLIQKVLDQLEEVALKMDEYETVKQAAAREAARKAAEAKEQAELLRFAALQQRVEQQKKKAVSTSTNDSNNVEASALSKLQLLMPPTEPPPIKRDPSGEEPLGPPSTRYGMLDDTDDEDAGNQALPPPMLPTALVPSSPTEPSAPPSYHQATQARRQGSNFWGPVQPSAPAEPPNEKNGGPVFSHQPPSPPPRKQQKNLPMRTLQKQCEQDYLRLKQQGRIRVISLDTYQGRVGASTNGCTVISALCVSHHLKASTGIQNSQISYVIDKQCGPLLREIRSKLGLGGHALIIPSDVHDHLVDCKLLPQDKFLGVAGGNILDREHIGEFFKLLAQAPRLAGATLFFREHVISLVKYFNPRQPNGIKQEYSYDLIDSMPGPNGKATRTTCFGLEALVVLVRWYASRKFSGSNSSYVDQNEWNDSLADVDPRVFQAFVWGEQPQ